MNNRSRINEGIELGDHESDEPSWYIADTNGRICSGPYATEQGARSDTRRLQWFTPAKHFIAYGIQDDDGMFVDPETGLVGESTHNGQVPEAGDTIRTKKMQMEGKVEKLGQNQAGYDEVHFRVADGRLMKTPLDNVIVIEKLADEDQVINEISNEVLAKYKTAAGKNATDADQRGDYAAGNKRFKGIVSATKKQFSNDAKKKTSEGSMGGINRSAPSNDVSYEDILDEVKERWNKEQLSELSSAGLKSYSVAAGKDIRNDTRDAENARRVSADKQIHGDLKGSDEWSDESDWLRGRAERRAGKVARATTKIAAKNPNINEDDLNEISVAKMQAYKDAAKSQKSLRTRPLGKIAKSVAGVATADRKINTKTGRNKAKSPDRGTFEERLAEFIDIGEAYHGPHAGDQHKLKNAPKSTMQGNDNVRFSDLVQDSIQRHGIKFAFDYYVKKHGLPPRQFKIYAGL